MDHEKCALGRHPNHDACGAGFVAHPGSLGSREVARSLHSFRLTHRGGVDADSQTVMYRRADMGADPFALADMEHENHGRAGFASRGRGPIRRACHSLGPPGAGLDKTHNLLSFPSFPSQRRFLGARFAHSR